MRRSTYGSIFLTLLLLAPLFSTAPDAFNSTSNSDVTYSTNQTWNGNISLSEDVIIANGATLVIEAGTQINITHDVTITIIGALEIQGTALAPVEIWGSWIAETSIQARWQGFHLNSGSSAIVANAHISDSRGGFDVENGAMLTISTTNFTDTIIGVWNKGTLSGAGINCNTATTSCLRVDGSATLSEVKSMLSAEVVHVHNGGNANIAVVTSNDDADVIVLEDGSTFYGQVNADGFNRLVRGSGTVSATVLLDVIGVGGVMVEAVSLGGLVVTGGSPCSSNCTVDSIVVGSVDDVEFSSLFLFCEETCVDARIDGELAFVSAWPSTEIFPSNAFARLRGDGLVRLNQINIQSTHTLFDVSGNGDMIIDNSTLRFSDAGTISGWSLDVSDTIMVDGEDGWVLLDVDATFSQIELVRPFSLSDVTSVGIHAVWSNVIMDDVILEGWNEGIRCESECTITGTELFSGGGGRNSGSGITIDGGTVELDTLSTSSSDIGINIIDGSAHISTWTVDNAHRSYGVQLANDASATIRNMPSYTSSGVLDGFGDGTLLWGSQGTPDLSVSIEEQFIESSVHVTDLVGNSISGATVSAHGFSEITNESGESMLPMLSSGSFVEASDPSSGMGASSILTPPNGTIQIAIVPGSGDWIIPAGVNAMLVDGEFNLNGNLTIESTGSLMLRDSTLTIPNTASLIIQPNGQLMGDNGQFNGGSGALTAGVPLRGEGQGLIVNSSLSFTCYDPFTWVRTSLSGSMTLSQDCELTLDDGSQMGPLSMTGDAVLRERTHLTVNVFDTGIAVEGANVSVAGTIVQTDQNGQSSFSTTWREVDTSSEVLADLKTIVVQHASVNRYRNWNPSSSEEINVMISTLSSGDIDGIVRLNPLFSPYHLGEDITIHSGSMVEILPGVELTLSVDSEILVEGRLHVDDAWIGGTGSNGIKAMNGGLIEMYNGYYSGGPLKIRSGGTAQLTNLSVNDAEVSVSSSTQEAILVIEGGQIHQSDICLRAQDEQAILDIRLTSINACGIVGIWATSAQLNLENIILGSQTSTGVWVQSSSGNITGLNATQHDGEGPALKVEMQDGTLEIRGLDLGAGSGFAALTVSESEGLQITDSKIHGAPGILIENSAILLQRVDLFGTGVGTGATIFGARNSAPVQLIDCDIDNYILALRLEGGINDLDSMPVEITDSHLHAQTSVESNMLAFTINGGVVDGDFDLIGIEKPWVASVIDIEPSSVNITGDARLVVGHQWLVNITDTDGNPIPNYSLSVEIPEFDSVIGPISHFWGDSPEYVSMYHRVYNSQGMMETQFGEWSIIADNYIPQSGQLMFTMSGFKQLSVSLNSNSNPVATIIEPQDNYEANAGDLIQFNASAADSDGDEITSWTWQLIGGDFNQILGESESGEFVAEQGEWTLQVTVTDGIGGEFTTSISFTVNAADNDNDFADTCQTQGLDAWYDPITGLLCGPDIFDEDDDNDGIRDDRDDFSFDSCAYKDTDGDSLPDSILNNCETDLVADEDDDNDGVVDSQDVNPLDPTVGLESPSESSTFAGVCSPAVVLSGGVLTIFCIFAYLRFRGQGNTSRIESKFDEEV